MDHLTLASGLRLAYKQTGNLAGIPIVLVHGFTGHCAGYDPFIALARDAFQILTLDQRGHGDSDVPTGNSYGQTLGMYTMEHFAADLKEVVDRLEFPVPFVLLGHSMGGMIAQVFTLAFPDYVDRLVLASTLPTYHTENMVNLLHQYKSGEMKRDAESLRLTAPMGYSYRWAKNHADYIEEGVQRKLRIPDDVHNAMLENFVLHFDVRPRLPEITRPTLVITGKRDAVIASKNSQYLHEHLPNSELVVIPRQNHGIFMEVPEVVYEHVHRFVTA